MIVREIVEYLNKILFVEGKKKYLNYLNIMA